MKKFLLLVSIFLAGVASGADDINLYEVENSALNEIPIYHQGSDGNCYAYTASQMIDYYHLTHTEPSKRESYEPTSALWVSYAHKRYSSNINWILDPIRAVSISNKDGLGYSDISYTFKDFKNLKNCPKSVLEKSISDYKKKTKLTDDDFLYIYQELFDVYLKNKKDNQLRKGLADRFKGEMKDLSPEEQEAFVDNKIFDHSYVETIKIYFKEVEESRYFKEQTVDNESYAIQLCQGVLRGGISKDNQELLESFRDIKNEIEKGHRLEVLGEHFFAGCTENVLEERKVPDVKSCCKGLASNKKIVKAIEKGLANEQPVAIGHCTNVFSYPKGEYSLNLSKSLPIPRVANLAPMKKRKECAPHYALVVGERTQDTGKEFLVRNSYGTKFWSKHHTCYCGFPDGHSGDCKYDQDKDKNVTVKGCWIGSEDLASVTFQVVRTDYKIPKKFGHKLKKVFQRESKVQKEVEEVETE